MLYHGQYRETERERERAGIRDSHIKPEVISAGEQIIRKQITQNSRLPTAAQ